MKPEISISKVFDADISLVWKAITEKELMKQWHFDLEEFTPEVGFTFEFKGGPEDGIQYNHLCEITEVEFEKKLTYSWKYEGYEGISFVSFVLTAEDGKTRLDFTHEGLSCFPATNPDFAIQNFEAGWAHFITKALPEFLTSKKYTMNHLLFDFITDKENNTLTIRREFVAGRQMVWDCYTKSDLLNRWFAPHPFTTKTKSMDFSEGGHWHYAMLDPTGPEYWGYVGFVKIKPNDFYTSIDSFCDADGNINGDLPAAEWVVSFSDKGYNTVVETVVQYQSLADLETIIQMGMEEGMKSTLTKLDDLLIQLKK